MRVPPQLFSLVPQAAIPCERLPEGTPVTPNTQELLQENAVLASFPPAARESLLPMLEPVSMALRDALFEPGQQPPYVHFMTSGLASIVTEMRVGEGVEVGLIGREGIPEGLSLLGPETGVSRCFVQMEGAALRMKFRSFQKMFEESAAIRAPVLQFVQCQSLVVSQLAACNRLHAVEERLARWLLMVADRAGRLEIELTQEFLAEMLGTRRSTVTLSAGTLQRSGLIQYQRGRIQILDREKLESVACECFGVTQRLLKKVYM